MNDCVQQNLQKQEKDDNKACKFFGKTFIQKCNRDLNVKTIHENEVADDSISRYRAYSYYYTTTRTFFFVKIFL